EGFRAFAPTFAEEDRAGGELRLGTVSMYMGALYANNKPNTTTTIQFTWEHCDAHAFGLSFVKSVACPRIEAHLFEELRVNPHFSQRCRLTRRGVRGRNDRGAAAENRRTPLQRV